VKANIKQYVADVPNMTGSWLQTANSNMEKFMGAMGVPW